jgi:hypothetical protein
MKDYEKLPNMRKFCKYANLNKKKNTKLLIKNYIRYKKNPK